ncbi:MAG TPA: helix-turn-helix transcriptional regulator [Brachybacterium paraconglomeratum]|uniref:Helix-turn-helix transcriptional regulator n=1 Tax=Brachybacterium paraconglomeratum TaxID=173362 RepID=A0A921KS31_9MICO|nr:helix-turn-helix transcriptional regulator [Brachybacterium paraconglomeratum]
MKLRDSDLLARYMHAKDFSQARLGRYAGVSRQFIHKLVSGDTKTCSRQVGELIEEALSVLPGTLFVPEESRQTRPTVSRSKTAA